MADYSNSRWKERGSFDKNILHSYQDIVDAIRTAPYGIDTREAMAQMLIFLYSATQSAGKGTNIDMSPTDAFANLDELKRKYPNGCPGVFVVQDTGHWYFWNEMERQWKDGGFYQAPKNKEVEDARAWSVQLGTNDKYLNLTDSLVSLYLRTVDDLRKEQKQRESVESSIKSYIDSLPKITYGKQEIFNIVDKDGLPIGSDIDTLTEIINTFDFGKVNDDYHKTMNLKSIFTPDFKYWSSLPVLELNEVSQDVLDFNATKGIECKDVKYRFLKKGLGGTLKSIKVQGSSSVNFPKKNYTLKFNEPVTLHDDWGSHTKYVIKSNFNDASQIRNILSAKLWGNIIRTRLSDTIEPINVGDDILADKNGNTLVGSSDRIMSIGKNYGAIDGYPIVVVINGVFHGLYTLNIPKDDWMADMGNGKKEAIISADDNHSGSTYFKDTPKLDGDFEIEYVGKDDSWIKQSLSTAISAVMSHYDNNNDYYTNINKYIDVDSAIDYFILCAVIDNPDGIGKNYLLDTYDGTKWYFNAYDMDCVIGVFRTWNGTSVNWRESNKFEDYASGHRMFYVIYNHMREKLISRYEYLRNNALSFTNLYNLTMDLYGSIPQFLFDEDHKKWMLTPTTSIRTADQIIFWLDKQLQKLDNEIKELKGDK